MYCLLRLHIVMHSTSIFRVCDRGPLNRARGIQRLGSASFWCGLCHATSQYLLALDSAAMKLNHMVNSII